MDEQSKKTDVKKQYEPPRLATISLRPEEAVLGHCKVAGGGGPAGVCGLLCQNIGS